jgi:hypothetical protein
VKPAPIAGQRLHVVIERRSASTSEASIYCFVPRYRWTASGLALLSLATFVAKPSPA